MKSDSRINAIPRKKNSSKSELQKDIYNATNIKLDFIIPRFSPSFDVITEKSKLYKLLLFSKKNAPTINKYSIIPSKIDFRKLFLSGTIIFIFSILSLCRTINGITRKHTIFISDFIIYVGLRINSVNAIAIQPKIIIPKIFNAILLFILSPQLYFTTNIQQKKDDKCHCMSDKCNKKELPEKRSSLLLKEYIF